MDKIRIVSNSPSTEWQCTLARFEDDASGRKTALSDALDWLDNMLDAVKGFSFFSALNQIQAECNLDRDPRPFPSKTDIPLCILNLVLKEHGLELKKD